MLHSFMVRYIRKQVGASFWLLQIQWNEYSTMECKRFSTLSWKPLQFFLTRQIQTYEIKQHWILMKGISYSGPACIKERSNRIDRCKTVDVVLNFISYQLVSNESKVSQWLVLAFWLRNHMVSLQLTFGDRLSTKLVTFRGILNSSTPLGRNELYLFTFSVPRRSAWKESKTESDCNAKELFWLMCN